MALEEVGEAEFLTMPGELFPDLGNDELGHIMSEEDFARELLLLRKEYVSSKPPPAPHKTSGTGASYGPRGQGSQQKLTLTRVSSSH